jgi:thioredoxin-like negative regulator of GroEL
MRQEIGNIEQLLETIKSENAVLLYFYNDDCPPCLSLRPKVEALLDNSFPEMKLVFVNSKSHPEIPASYGVFANPTLIIFFDGKEFKRFSKYISTSELHQAIERYYNIIFA